MKDLMMAEGIDDVLDFSLVPWGNAYVVVWRIITDFLRLF